jgi:hypothetical protein
MNIPIKKTVKAQIILQNKSTPMDTFPPIKILIFLLIKISKPKIDFTKIILIKKPSKYLH